MTSQIRAGKFSEIRCDSGEWLIVDLGFSSKHKSCGVVKGLSNPCCKVVTFGTLVETALREARRKDAGPLNLLLEAPLSVAFDQNGNPKGRWFEKRDAQYRYWYCNAGAGLILASLKLLQRLNESEICREIRLFEGFVSFKPKGAGSSHCDDVKRLQKAVCDPDNACIINPYKDEMRDSETDCIKSVFTFAGMDFNGIPPVIFG